MTAVPGRELAAASDVMLARSRALQLRNLGSSPRSRSTGIRRRWATEEEEGATIIRLPVRPMPALLNADVADAPGAWSLAIDRPGNKGGTGADQDRAVVAQRPGGRR